METLISASEYPLLIPRGSSPIGYEVYRVTWATDVPADRRDVDTAWADTWIDHPDTRTERRVAVTTPPRPPVLSPPRPYMGLQDRKQNV